MKRSDTAGTAGLDADVIIVGAGPAGLGLANLLGIAGVRVLVLEALPELIDYPRGVGIDDESLRGLQTMGLIEQVLPHTTPQHIMRLVNGRGRMIIEIAPGVSEFGWSRRNGFNQPEVDRVMYEGLARFPHVEVLFDHEVSSVEDRGDHVEARVGDRVLTARYLVGAEGGRSLTRKHIGVDFPGISPSTRWVVVDIDNDPLGTPNVYLGADPSRPYVSIGLPGNIRRFEWMLFDDESTELVDDPAFIEKLLAEHIPDPATVDVTRKRVFTHHSRIASDFRSGRLFIAGDAAHLMPVWQGQGWNSGQRDIANLAWKLAAVVHGVSGDALLDTYTPERHDHAKAMIDLSTDFGRIIKPTNRLVAGARDAAFTALNVVPSIKAYFAQMKYKPMPRYARGALVDATTFEAGHSENTIGSRTHAHLSASSHVSPVGTLFIQPTVFVPGQGEMLLDDAIGYNCAVVQFIGNPEDLFTPEQRDVLARLGARLVSVRPGSQSEVRPAADPEAIVAGDPTGALKRWFDQRPTPVVVLRPDRFVAAAGLAQDAGRMVEALAEAVSLLPAGTSTPSDPPAAPFSHVPATAELEVTA